MPFFFLKENYSTTKHAASFGNISSHTENGFKLDLPYHPCILLIRHWQFLTAINFKHYVVTGS